MTRRHRLERFGHCSAVIWDVGGTLVDRNVGPGRFTEWALQTVGLSSKAIPLASLARAYQLHREIEAQWRTLEEEAKGYRAIARVLLAGTSAAGDPLQVELLAQGLGDYFWVYHPVPGMPALLHELAAGGIRQAVLSNWPPSL